MSAPKPLKSITGYVGVMDGRAYFERRSDDKGDCRVILVFETKAQALERWAYARRVKITLLEELPQPRGRGPL